MRPGVTGVVRAYQVRAAISSVLWQTYPGRGRSCDGTINTSSMLTASMGAASDERPP